MIKHKDNEMSPEEEARWFSAMFEAVHDFVEAHRGAAPTEKEKLIFGSVLSSGKPNAQQGRV